MGKKHTDALKAKLQEIPAFAGVKTGISVIPHATVAPYLVIHPARGSNTQERVTGPRTAKHPRYTLHLVGETAEQVEVLGDLVEAKLFPAGRGITLTVVGEKSFPLWFESPMPVQVQTDPQPTVIYLVVEVGWMSEGTS